MSHFLKPSSDFHPQNKVNIFAMLHKALYAQAHIISSISSPSSLAYSLHSSYSTPLAFKNSSHIPTSGPELTISARNTLPQMSARLTLHLLCVSTQSLCLSETLPTGSGQMPIILPTLSFLCFFPLHFSPSGIFVFITTKNVNFYKSMSPICI